MLSPWQYMDKPKCLLSEQKERRGNNNKKTPWKPDNLTLFLLVSYLKRAVGGLKGKRILRETPAAGMGWWQHVPAGNWQQLRKKVKFSGVWPNCESRASGNCGFRNAVAKPRLAASWMVLGYEGGRGHRLSPPDPKGQEKQVFTE